MMLPCESTGKCLNEQRLLALEADKERNSNQHREFYDEFKKTAVNHATTKTTYDQILSTMSEIKDDVSELKAKPGKKYEGLVDSALKWIVLALLAATTIFN